MQRLRDDGFTEAQATAIVDAIQDATGQLLTRGYFDVTLQRELRNTKRDLLAWTLVMQAPVYAALIYLSIKLGG